ncbi:DegT/DnrJ/EryC1/StrS family aminotransferase [Candidatus Peregrinibacteria bacterium]|nr:DegT/DnrJ/EryC1/StrS family aminotransferase [Candidatus Peregrinibacteria bacterium]
MANPKIPWWLPQVGSDQERKLINQALDNNFINEGPLATKFEQEIAQLVGTKYAIATPNCTAAIFLSLKALGIGHGDEVLVPDMTFIATANAVDLTGARTVLVDVHPDTLTIDMSAARKAITSRTKAIVPVHVTGRASDMDALLTLANDHRLAIVEDAAEALMSKYHSQFLGTIGKTGCFSFSPNKTITTGQGGMIVTNDPELHTKLRMLKDQGRPVRGTGGDDRHDVIGYNFKFTDLQAAVGLGQLSFLNQRITRMKRNYELYAQELKNINGLTIFPNKHEEIPQWTDAIIERRDELETYLRTQNIDCRKYWFPLHQQLAYRLPDDNFPHSTSLSPKCLWLPSAFTLTDEAVLTVCIALKKFLRTV